MKSLATTARHRPSSVGQVSGVNHFAGMAATVDCQTAASRSDRCAGGAGRASQASNGTTFLPIGHLIALTAPPAMMLVTEATDDRR
jgi:hypothetical protein